MPSSRTIKNSVFLLDRDEVHLCILCFRAILSYKHGMTAVFAHKTAMDQICLSLVTSNLKTKVNNILKTTNLKINKFQKNKKRVTAGLNS